MNTLKKTISLVLIVTIIVFTGCTMAPQNPKAGPNPDGLSLETGKVVYAKNEPVELLLKNNGTKSVYVMPRLFNALDFSGSVYTGTEKTSINTFNIRASVTSRGNYSVPQPVEIKPGQSLKIKWTGQAYIQTGPDDKNDWESFQPTGKFRIGIYYAFDEKGFTKDSIIPFIESNEFEIKDSSFKS